MEDDSKCHITNALAIYIYMCMFLLKKLPTARKLKETMVKSRAKV